MKEPAARASSAVKARKGLEESAAVKVADVKAPVTAEATKAALSSISDSLRLIGAEAYLLEDTELLQQHRQANAKIRALLGSRKKRTGTAEGSSGSQEASTESAAAAVGTDGLGPPSERPTQNNGDTCLLPLPEYTPLPDLPESPPPGRSRPLRPWQHQQHQQLLLLQQRQLQQQATGSKKPEQGGPAAGTNDEDVHNRQQPQLQRGEKAEGALSAGGAAVVAAGEAAARSGADFFGRLHAECLEVLRRVRPGEEEERRKREAAGRVRAVCRLLWGHCWVEVFGSSFTALGLSGSDIDICVFADQGPPLHQHYACSRCVCCSSSRTRGGEVNSISGSSSRATSKQEVLDDPDNCGAEAVDGSCCCSSVPKRHRRRGSENSSCICNSSCRHGGSEGFRDLQSAAERCMSKEESYCRRSAVSRVREFAHCLRGLNQAAAAAKRRGLGSGRGSERFADCIEPIVSARVPICKFKDAETGVSVDLSFDQPSAVLTSLYVRHKLSDFTLLQPLVVLNKMLLRHWRLHEPFKGGVGSYLLFVMCLHFLQNNPYLSDAEKYRRLNLGHLLFHFLHYYGVQFNYETTSISVRGSGSLMPKGKGWYRGTANRREDRTMLHAESPLDPSIDLGRSAYKIMQVRSAWRKAYLRLAASLMSEMRGSFEPRQQDAASSQEPLLSCVFGSSTWHRELRVQHPHSSSRSDKSSRCNSELAIATPRPGLWISKEVAAATQAAVQDLFGSSAELRRFLVTGGRHHNKAKGLTDSFLGSGDMHDESSDDDSSLSMRRRPWERRQQVLQKQPSRLSASTYHNTHVLFDSSEDSSSDTFLPVRGFVSSRSCSPAMRPATRLSTGEKTAPSVDSAETEAAASSAAVPTLISVDDSSDGDCSVVEIQQVRREANKQKRKRRRERQAAEREKKRRVTSQGSFTLNGPGID